MMRKRLAMLVVSAAIVVGLAGPAAATYCDPEPDPTAKCNSGRGNDSETTPENDCDPGNSGGHNQGGD